MTRTTAAAAACLAAVLLALPAEAGAQVDVRIPEEQPRTVHVSATGTVQRQPDRGVVMLAVESLAETAQAAAAENARKMDALIAALRRLGIAPAQIRTVSYQLNPQYDRRPDRAEPRITGYRALNMVRVVVDEIERVGPVIDAAIAAGANRVANLSFELKDPETARLEALQRAVSQARAEAEAVAAALGERLGPALTVHVAGGMRGPRPMVRTEMMEADVAMRAPTPVEPGELDVAVTVNVVFELLGR